MNNRGNRLRSFIEYKKLALKEFGEEIGASKGTVNHWMNNKSMTVEWLTKISEKYRELNIYWLLSGEGEMIKMNNGENNSGEKKKIEELEEKVRMLEEINHLLKELNELKKKS